MADCTKNYYVQDGSANILGFNNAFEASGMVTDGDRHRETGI